MIALPVSREMRIRRSVGRLTARRSRRIPVRPAGQTLSPRSPVGSGPRTGEFFPARLSPFRTHRSGSPRGLPSGVTGNVDRAIGRGKPEARLVFAIFDCFSRAVPVRHLRDLTAKWLPGTRETPRELRPKPQPSRGSRATCRESGPPAGGDPERPKPLLPRPGRTRVGRRENTKSAMGFQPRTHSSFRALPNLFAGGS